MADCPKLAKRRKLEEESDAEKSDSCIKPGHDETKGYFGANMENRAPKWTLIEAQKKGIERYKKAIKPINPKMNDTNSPLQRIKLETPRITTKTKRRSIETTRRLAASSGFYKHTTQTNDD